MQVLLAALLASSQGVYAAKVETFACNSALDVSSLVKVRADEQVFAKTLLQKIVYGDCVTIPKGQIVDGVSLDGSTEFFRISTELVQPGFIAPTADFEEEKSGGDAPPVPADVPVDKAATTKGP